MPFQGLEQTTSSTGGFDFEVTLMEGRKQDGPFPLLFDGGDKLHLNGGIAGQSCKADRGPCADAGISELLVEIFGDNVSDFGMGGVIGCCIDVNGQREDLCNPLVR